MRASILVASVFSIILGPSAAWGMFMLPTDAPADRLIKNVTAYIKEHPDDVTGYYTLGRIHYLAFAKRAFEVGVSGDPNAALPRVAPDWLLGDHGYRLHREHAEKLALEKFGYPSWTEVPKKEQHRLQKWAFEKAEELKEQGWHPPGPTDEELNAHAAAAARNFENAIGLAPKKALYHLGLACLLEQYVDYLKETKKVPEEFRSIIREKARETYYTAYSMAIKADLRRKSLPISGLESLVGHEAGNGYLRLSDASPNLPGSEERKRAAVAKNVERLKKLPLDAITPIIFASNARAPLSDLLAPNTQAPFDLDGDGAVEMWPWVKPTTGILVWDPARTGEITSGRQLFGSVTWWLFFSDGYRALDGLDDNRDGELTGCELAGISAWFDRNSNGCADKGEVATLRDLQITSVATRATGEDGNCLMNEDGLTFQDGQTVPTYDWVVSQTPAPDRVP